MRRFVPLVPSRTAFVRLALGGLFAAGLAMPSIQAQIPGRNVNMVSGTKWPDGDPYLQRQNEPSIAVSTRNTLHLLAGANDYRTVDVPFVDGAEETGDAWLGIFKSFDGGQRWRTTLLPGYPQDTSPEGMSSPIKGYQAGADPVVRAGTNGLFYYAGLVFDRVENGRSAVFVARYIDNNNQEDNYKANPEHVVGDPIRYAGARIVASDNGKRFLDKPWIAVDIPRDGRTCRIPGPNNTVQVIPAGTVYAAFSSIYEDRRGLRSDILLSRSTDCGASWSPPAKVNGDSRINQGASIAIDPRSGTVHVAWRKFASSATAGETDGIMAARSVDGGRRFSTPGTARAFERGRGKKTGLDPESYFEHRRKSKGKPKKPVVGSPVMVDTELDEFDQATSDIDGFLMFRTNAYPSMALDGTGRIYLAWAERGFTSSPQNDARIVIATSSNGRDWTQPKPVSEEGQSGHQLMPSMTFGGGRLVLVYYDLREDISGQFTQFIDDKGAIASASKRHTLDLRTSVGLPGATPVFAPSVRVSDYLVAFRTLQGTLVEEQVQFNPPNLPMFKKGTAPFMGDYVDVAVSPAFVPTASGGWAFNTNGPQPVFHAVWTDNRDVRQPVAGPDGKVDWSKYTPPTSRTGSSIFDPTQGMTVCDPNSTGSRNQNIYTARLSTGLVVGSPGNTKPLSPTIQRAFVVFAQNTSPTTKSFRMTIASQPLGGRASFRQFDVSSTGQPLGPLTSIIVTTPARSTAARTVYATSSNPHAQVVVDVVEVSYGGTTPVVPLADRVILNPDITNPDIANPDIANPDIANPDIANAEVYNPDIANPDIANPDIANPDIANPDIANPDIANPDIANPDIANPDIANPDIANPDIANALVANPDIANPDIANPDIANPDIANPDIANPDIANPDIANGSLTDVTWTMTNNGNTTAAFNVNLFLAQQTDKICQAGAGPNTGCITTQLILRKVYATPVSTNCQLQVQSQNVLLANIPNPKFVLPGEGLPDQNSDAATNATLWLAPGETAKITLRVYDPVKSDDTPVNDTDGSTPTAPRGSFIDPLFLPTTTTDLGSVTPVVQQQSVDTEDIVKAIELGVIVPKPPIVTPLSPPVPSGETEDPKPTPLTLAFVQQPTTTPVGSVVAPAVSVAVRDQYGALLPNAPVTLFLGTNRGGAVLAGATATSNADGLATFPGLAIGTAGEGYTIVATSGQALPAVSSAFNIGKRAASVFLSVPAHTYDGLPKSAGVTTVPPDLSTTVTYNGSATPPSAVGTYAVFATVTDPIYDGSATGTLVINPAAPMLVPVTLSGLNAVHDDLPKPVTVTTGQPGISVSVTYDGSLTPPSAVGAYAVVATVTQPGYTGSATGTLDIRGLVSLWRGDGNTVDSVGSNNGSLMGGASFSQGRVGQAFNFANSSFPDNQFVLVGNLPGLQLSNAGTIAAWINPAGRGLDYDNGVITGEGGIIVNKENSYEVARFGDGTIRWAFNGDPCWCWVNTGVIVPAGQWTHVAVTYDAGLIRTYLNGVLSHTHSSVGRSGEIAGSSGEFRIGGRQDSDTLGRPYRQNFDGTIDEVAIYNRVLAAGEVLGLYSAAPPLLALVGPAGGGGGSEFGPVDCAAGSVVVGFVGNAGDDIDRTSIVCAPTPALAPTNTLFAAGGTGGDDYGPALTCGANSAVTGIHGRSGSSWGGVVVDTLGVTCTNLLTNATVNLGPVGNVGTSSTPFAFSCPAGTQVFGIQGKSGGLLDQLSIRCR